MEEAGECPASRAHGGCFWEAPGAPPVLTTPRGAEELGGQACMWLWSPGGRACLLAQREQLWLNICREEGISKPEPNAVSIR